MLELTKQQQQAVECTDRKIACIAVAGSGKTRVLTERVVHLIVERCVAPAEIMVVTFTRKAAREMRERIVSRLGAIDADCRKLKVDTFHGIAIREMEEDPELVGYRPGIAILGEQDAQALLDRVMADLGIYAKKDTAATRRMLSTYYSQGSIERGYGDTPTAKKGLTAINEYHSRLQAMNAVDYGLLLLKWSAILDALPDTAHARYILVDEAQDCDALQWSIVQRIAERADLFAVGDPRQAIYGWRGGSYKHLADLASEYTELRLDDSFRCATTVSAAATIVSEPLGMGPTIPAIDRPGWVRVIDDADGATFEGITAVFKEAHDCPSDSLSVAVARPSGPGGDITPRDVATGLRWADMAILARTNKSANWISDVLARAGIPCHRAGHAARVADTPEFRRLWGAAALINNRDNDAAFYVLASDLGVEDRITELRRVAFADGTSLWTALTKLDVIQRTKMFCLIATSKYGQTFSTLRDMLSPSAELRALLDEVTSPDDTYPEALQAMQLIGANDLDKHDRDEVYVGTMHGAKGLEWPLVVVAGLDEGYLPAKTAASSETKMNDDRRLAYVAMTRAQDVLLLHHGGEPSLFVREIQKHADA